MLTSQSENPLELNGERVSGAEHHVWLDKARGLVRKIPSKFGALWQKMHPDFAERDLEIMMAQGVPLVPTIVRREADVCVVGQTRSRVNYVLEQPLCNDSHSMTYADMLHSDRYRNELLEFARKGREIRTKNGLGFDLLGGKALKLIGPALNPFRKKMPAEVANLLVADSDIVAQKDWPTFNLEAGDVIAREGEVRQCDTRMYDFERDNRLSERAIRSILLKIQDLQDAVVWALLRTFGYKDEFGLDKTRFRRMARKLVEHARPKMIAHAEAMG